MAKMAIIHIKNQIKKQKFVKFDGQKIGYAN